MPNTSRRKDVYSPKAETRSQHRSSRGVNSIKRGVTGNLDLERIRLYSDSVTKALKKFSEAEEPVLGLVYH